jgi:hypothetical protein
MERRQFLKAATVAAVASGVLGRLSSASPAAAAAGFVTSSGGQLGLDGARWAGYGPNIWRANIDATDKPPNTGYLVNPVIGSTLDAMLVTFPHCTLVRSWYWQQFAQTSGARDWTRFDNTLNALAARGLKALVCLINQEDWERTNAGTANYVNTAWWSGGYATTTISTGNTVTSDIVPYKTWVGEFLDRYANNTAIAVVECVNEPRVNGDGSCPANAGTLFTNFAADMGAFMRAHDPNHCFMLGTFGWGQCGYATEADWISAHQAFDTAAGGNTVVGTHSYISAEPGFTLPNPSDNAAPAFEGFPVHAADAAGLGLPILVDERGIRAADCPGSTKAEQDASRADYEGQKLAYDTGVANFAGACFWQYDQRDYTFGTGDSYVVAPGNPVLATYESYAAGAPPPPPPPVAVTQAASGVTATGATLNGTVNPEGSATTWHYEYGKTTAYGTVAPVPDGPAGSGTAAVPEPQPVTGLAKNTTYHYRLTAASGAGSSHGADMTFKTLRH